jgi:uncharacterized protein with PIN domain
VTLPSERDRAEPEPTGEPVSATLREMAAHMPSNEAPLCTTPPEAPIPASPAPTPLEPPPELAVREPARCEPPPEISPDHLFLLDKTVGRLARWLRVLGYDAAWDPSASPRELLQRAREQSRILLTRDTLLVRRREVSRGVVRAVLVRHDSLVDQLLQLREELGLRPRGDPRCMVCNGTLQTIEREAVRNRVPPYVAATETDFHYCSACDRVTWPATHWQGMRRILERAGLCQPSRPGDAS